MQNAPRDLFTPHPSPLFPSRTYLGRRYAACAIPETIAPPRPRIAGSPRPSSRALVLSLSFISFTVSAVHAASPAGTRPAAAVLVAPAPVGEELSADYTVTVEDRPTPVYRCRVSAVPLNQVWPGYQRPLDQTELASFAYWDMAGAVRVEVVAARAPKTAAVRPTRLGIRPKIDGRRISFILPSPAHCTVELDGPHHALHLFASPLEQERPRRDDPAVRYFGPGVHKPGRIELQSNQTVYVAAGAVAHGYVVARDARNIRIVGRGILDAASFERGAFHGIVGLHNCEGVVVDGLVLRDPPSWTVVPAKCRNVKMNDLKLIGLWRYNSDGIDVVNSQDITITNCFIRSFDDSLIVKGLKSCEQQPVRNVFAGGCVIWNDWGKALAIGPETCGPEIADVVFRDCDIIRTADSAMHVHGGDRARIRNVRFEKIRFEIDPAPVRQRLQTRRDERYVPDPADRYCPLLLVVVVGQTSYSQDSELGSIDGVHLADIDIIGPCTPGSYVRGAGAEHDVENVTVDAIRHNGQPVDREVRARLSGKTGRPGKK